MALPLQPVPDPATNQNFQEIAKRFPIQSRDVADSVKALFLQLVAPGDVSIDLGTATVEWPGASQYSSELTVAHELKATPSVVLLTAQTFAFVCEWHAGTATNFKVRAFETQAATPPPKGTNGTISWIAIG